jgi:hypothetical protein
MLCCRGEFDEGQISMGPGQTMTTQKHLWNLLAAIPLLALLCWYVWPTPYIVTNEGSRLYRVHRFTGQRQELTTYGWKTTAEVARMKEVFAQGRSRMMAEREGAMAAMRAREAQRPLKGHAKQDESGSTRHETR